jgi:hypothetical protein
VGDDPETSATHNDVSALVRARAALLDHLPKDLILSRYEQAGGKEVLSGKFSNPESSASLAANAFGLFLDQPNILSLPTPVIPAGTVVKVSLEAQMRFPWSGGLHPWLDVAVETEDKLIGIESKRYEPFRDTKSVSFSEAYSRPVWGDSMAPFEKMRDALAGGRTQFLFLDAAQLVKHAFGLRTQGVKLGKSATLVYLYAEPKAYPDGRLIPDDEIAGHRVEVANFTNAVSDPAAEVGFESLCYSELLAHWKNSQNEMLRNHAIALLARFDM